MLRNTLGNLRQVYCCSPPNIFGFLKELVCLWSERYRTKDVWFCKSKDDYDMVNALSNLTDW